MPVTTIDIHALQHDHSLTTLETRVSTNLDHGFADVSVDNAEGEEGEVTVKVTLQYKENKYETDAEVRRDVEEVLASTKLHIESTEIDYGQPVA